MRFISLEHLSPQLKVYLFILHSVVVGLIVHVLVTAFNINTRRKKSEHDNVSKKNPSSVRTVLVDGKRVTVESCQWINTILNWLHINASNTPDLIKIWLTMLNEKLKIEKSSLKCKINGIIPGSLPPKLTNVYCSSVSGSNQCVALHIESTRLGFYVSLFNNDNSPTNSSDAEVNITKLSGELIFQILARQSHYDLTVKFIGNPDLKVSSSDISKDNERFAIEEKLKEVICKTVVNIPLTDIKPGVETSAASPVSQSSSSCTDLEGKLLVKVIKASGLTGKDEADIPHAYCVTTCREPRQKKKTITLKGSKDPFWNESHVLDISANTKEIAFDVYNELKTPEGENYHLDDYSGKSNDTGSDFLGQVIVPLAMIGKEQSCRLILPILPISEKSSYVTGQISLEFTYDKDGKVFASRMQPQPTSLKNDDQAATADVKVADVQETTGRSAEKVVFSMATLDIVEDEDNKLQFEPLEDHGIGREDIVMAEQRISKCLAPTNTEHDEISAQEDEKHSEMLQELIELDSRNQARDLSQNKGTPKETEEKETDDRPLSRQSNEPSQATSPCEVVINPPSQTSVQSTDDVEGAASPDGHVYKELMEDVSPSTRRKVFRKAFSMRINRDQQQPDKDIEEIDEKKPVSLSENRRSFSAGDNIPTKTKSGSDVSLESLYEGTKSVLVVETKERGKVNYYQIPPLMAKRGTYDHKGTKLHICNDHLFVATHFSGSLPSCFVCKAPLTGYFGKQGYECRDCQMVTHKRCHLESNSTCPKSTLTSMKIIVPEQISN